MSDGYYPRPYYHNIPLRHLICAVAADKDDGVVAVPRGELDSPSEAAAKSKGAEDSTWFAEERYLDVVHGSGRWTDWVSLSYITKALIQRE